MGDGDSRCLDAGLQQIEGFCVELDVNFHGPQVEAETLVKVSALLAQLDVIDARIREAVTRDFATLPLLKDYLVPELFELEESYRASLFPGCADAGSVGPEAFFKALTMCRVGYYDRYEVSGRDVGEVLIVDYRFLVDDLLPEDGERQAMFLLFQGRYDITNQVVCARIGMDGLVEAVSVES